MKVEVKEVEELVREISVEVEPDVVNEQMDSKLKELRSKADLKGFRKGKAPMDVIKKKFGEDVKADVAENLIKTTYPEAVREHDLQVAAPPTITEFDFKEDGGISYTARVEIMPTLDKIEFDDLEVTGVDIEITDEEVDQAMQQIRKSLGEQRPVEREAKADDIVVVNLKKTYDPDNTVEEDEFPDAQIDLSNPVTVKEFKEQVPGMKKGETREIEVKYDDDYPDKAFAGATVRYEITLKDVREEILPEVNDQLAKSTGQAETLLELRMKIREDIQRQKENEIRRLNRNEVVQQLVEKNKFPVPDGVVNNYLGAMVEDIQQRQPDADEAQVRSAYHGVAVTTLRWNMLYNKLAEQEGIQISPEDTDKVIKRFAENYNLSEQQAAEALHKSGKVASIRDTLLEDKVLDLLIGRAKVVKKKPEETAEQS